MAGLTDAGARSSRRPRVPASGSGAGGGGTTDVVGPPPALDGHSGFVESVEVVAV